MHFKIVYSRNLNDVLYHLLLILHFLLPLSIEDNKNQEILVNLKSLDIEIDETQFMH